MYAFLVQIDGHVYSFENGKEDEPVRKSAEGEYTEGLLEKKNVMRTCSEQNFYITELQLRKCNKYCLGVFFLLSLGTSFAFFLFLALCFGSVLLTNFAW